MTAERDPTQDRYERITFLVRYDGVTGEEVSREEVARMETPAPWRKDYPQDRLCECGDPYDRHFDTCEDMEPVGCKYCPCRRFRPANT